MVFAPVKSIERMRDKVKEYEAPDATWPLCANILDPVRCSLICQGPLQVVEVVRWFLELEEETQNKSNGISVSIIGVSGDAAGNGVAGGGDGSESSAGLDRAQSESDKNLAPSLLSVVYIKNRFALPREKIPDGYRDVKLFARFTDSVSGLSIVGEIQIHDRELHEIKLQMHKLYKVIRAKSADTIS